jgi:enterochelin esterase family protein
MRPLTALLLLLFTGNLAIALDPPPDPDFPLGPDSHPKDGVPQGIITRHDFRSDIFKGTLRQYYLYLPANYTKETEAALMVFQDGHAYVQQDGQFRVPTVFDNLIHSGEMPPTVGVFVNPGWFTDKIEGRQAWKAPEGVQTDRSVEYDTLSDAYVRMLDEELLPEIEKTATLSKDPTMRAICGMSSGGICAFTAAWQRPQSFAKVVSHIGSFTNIRGGDAYPGIIRKTEKKPLRIFLQDGSNDLNNRHGNWWLGNLQMESALEFMDYDLKTAWGEGSHDGKHGGAIFPDTMRWLWRDRKKSG